MARSTTCRRRFRERRAAQEQQEAADRRGSLLEVAGERLVLGPEEVAARVAAQLELEQRQREAEARERGRLLEVD